jgi:hypothetical protein
LGDFFENYISSQHFELLFSQSIDYVLILTNNAFGYILGDFFIKHLVTLFLSHLTNVRLTSIAAWQSRMTDMKMTSMTDCTTESVLAESASCNRWRQLQSMSASTQTENFRLRQLISMSAS